jgi:hypothetical protein
MILWYTSGSVTYGLSIRSTLWISSLVIGWFRRVFEREPKP